MNSVLRLAVSFAAGAAVMYYFDPIGGRRRRKRMQDQAVSVGHDAAEYGRVKTKRAADRLRGTLAKTRAKVAPQPVGDEQLHDRIRARLGHVIDRPAAVEVQVQDGNVVLRGNVLATELDEVVETVSSMHGVESVDNRLSYREREESRQGSADARSVQH
jgi:hyperosmotically inducible periplasmic protein